MVALLHVVMFYAFTHGMTVTRIFKPGADPVLVVTPPVAPTKPPPKLAELNPKLPTTVVDTFKEVPQLQLREELQQSNPEIGPVIKDDFAGQTGEGPVVPETDTTLTVVRRVDPAYPAAARRAGQQGTVVLSVMVDADGHVSAATVMRSSGSMELDDAALTAIKRWKFSPRNGGTQQVHVPITFRLQTISF